jgi:hypothetical protein
MMERKKLTERYLTTDMGLKYLFDHPQLQIFFPDNSIVPKIDFGFDIRQVKAA